MGESSYVRAEYAIALHFETEVEEPNDQARGGGVLGVASGSSHAHARWGEKAGLKGEEGHVTVGAEAETTSLSSHPLL